MSAEEVVNSGVSQFRGFGHPRESAPYEVSVDPTMQRMLAEVSAGMEAEKVRKEAEMDTPEGRKKAAEAELAEKERKKSNWATRVVMDRKNGWKPIWGTVEDEELRIYTLLDTGEHRFWGTKPTGMGIYEFWDRYDPEVRRYEDRQQETPVNPDAPAGPLIGEPQRTPRPPDKAATEPKRRPGTSMVAPPPPTEPVQRKKVTTKPGRPQKTPDLNPTHRVRKSTTESTTESPEVNRKTRKSLTDKLVAGHRGVEDQTQEVSGTARARGRPTRNKAAVTASSARQETTSEAKRPRGRPATKEKRAGKPPSQEEKSPAVKGNARVTKAPRPPAPSTHTMRTRRAGPAEPLRLR